MIPVSRLNSLSSIIGFGRKLTWPRGYVVASIEWNSSPLEKEHIAALRAGSVMLTYRFILSIMAGPIAGGERRRWREKAAGFALTTHAVWYLRAEVDQLDSPVAPGRGMFGHCETSMGSRFFRYNMWPINAFDSKVKPHDFTVVGAGQSNARIFREWKRHISHLELRRVIPRRALQKPAPRMASKAATKAAA